MYPHSLSIVPHASTGIHRIIVRLKYAMSHHIPHYRHLRTYIYVYYQLIILCNGFYMYLLWEGDLHRSIASEARQSSPDKEILENNPYSTTTYVRILHIVNCNTKLIVQRNAVPNIHTQSDSRQDIGIPLH